MSYLLSLSQEERDDLFSTLVYVDKPLEFGGFMGTDFGHRSLVNYSNIYAGLEGKQQHLLPVPLMFRTGDCVQNHDYRGCGKHYAIWLRKGLLTHDANYIQTFTAGIVNVQLKVSVGEYEEDDCDTESEENDEEESADGGQVDDSMDNFLPTFVPRDADGPHNDGKHDCYLSVHPDEYGYAPSTAFSSLPPEGYFPHLQQFTESTFDPLLTHSKSHFGRIIQVAKESDKYIDDPDFSMKFVGTWDSELGAGIELEWMPLDDRRFPTENYIARLRDIFNRHFDESAKEISFDAENRRGGKRQKL